MCLNELSARSRFRAYHPAEGLLLGGGALLVALGGTRPAPLLLMAAIVIVLTLVIARPPLRIYLGLISSVLPFLILAGLALSLSINSHGISFSEAGFQQAVINGLRAFTCSLCSLFLCFAHPPQSWTYLLARLPLPPGLRDLTAYSLQSIFLLANRAWHMLLAQQARLGHQHWRASIRSTGMLAAQLWQRTLTDLHHWHVGIGARAGSGQIRTLSFLPPPSLARMSGVALWHLSMLVAMHGGASA